MDFYTHLSKYYNDLFPPNGRQIQFLTQHLPAQGKVLDIGAGTGGYAAALAARGAAVEAMEIGSMVPYLLQTAERHGFSAFDMGMEQVRALPKNAYGLVYCIGNTLVHLANVTQITTFLQDCRHLLLPGGSLILQIVNYDRVVSRNQDALPDITVPDKHLALKRNYVIGEGTVQFITRLYCDDAAWVSETQLLALKQVELAHCLKEAGFVQVHFHGDFEGASWTSDSAATIVVAYC